MNRKLNKRRIVIRAIWSAASRMIAVCLGAVVGSMIYSLINGHITNGWFTALSILFVGFLLMLFAEYEKGMHN